MATEQKNSSGLLTLVLWLFLIFVAFRFYKPSTTTSASEPLDISGQKFVVPKSALEREPLIDKVPKEFLKVASVEKPLTVSTPLVALEFDRNFASIRQIRYKKIKGEDQEQARSTPFGDDFAGCLLLSVDGDIPSFSLKTRDENDDFIRLVFEGVCCNWTISKIFKIFKKSYQVGMDVEFLANPSATELKKPVLFFGVPNNYSKSGKKPDAIMNKEGSFVNLATLQSSNLVGIAWKKPVIFGGEDRFFLHSLFAKKENQDFVKRGYFIEQGNDLTAVIELWPVISEVKYSLDFFFGPKKLDDLQNVDDRLGDVLAGGFFGHFYKFVLKLLETLNSYFGNYGWALVVLAFLLRLPLLPLSFFSSRKKYFYEKFEKQYASEIAEIDRKFGHSIVQKSEQMAKFYQYHEVSQNAKAFVAIPGILQIIIALSLYRFLGNYVSLHKAPFLTWITDLSAKDPYYLCPAVLGLVQFLQFNLSSQEIFTGRIAKLKFLKFVPPVIIFGVFSAFPAGAVIYWLCNSLFSVIEEQLFKRMFKN